MPTSTASIRRFQRQDLPHLYAICLLTGDRGHDASASCSHERLLGDYYAVPYAVYDPELCLILSDELGPCGYILGTDATSRFVDWFNAVWLPRLRAEYRGLVPRPGASDGWLVERLAQDVVAPADAVEFPAHLHLDLLPRIQGRGFGRQLFTTWLELLAARGARGVHAGVAKDNLRARRFYEQMGMRRVETNDDSVFYGLALTNGAIPSPTAQK